MANPRNLTDVPEEDPQSPFDEDNITGAFGNPTVARGAFTGTTAVYSMPSASGSSPSLHPNTSTLNGTRSAPIQHTARRTSSLRSLVPAASDNHQSSTNTSNGNNAPSLANPSSEATQQQQHQQQQQQQQQQRSTLRRATSGNSSINGSGGNTATRQSSSSVRHRDAHIPRMRSTPRLVHEKDAEPAPSTGMYWSRAPVYGAVPNRTMRAHSVTLVDNTVWLFGGCDERESWKDIYCLDVETMQWSHPECLGDTPQPSRAHSATLVDRKIVFIGGGHGSVYYDSIYILDTHLRRWSRPTLAPGPKPPQRRAHTAVLYGTKIWVFGGGNGMMALSDVWTLDVTALLQYGPYGYNSSGSKGSIMMKWELVETRGVKKPGPRGYHTTNLVGNIMVVIGGSDGKESFDELWTLDLDTRIWTQIKTNMPYKRLAHSSTQVGSYLFIFGGHDSTEYTSELLLLNLVSLQYESRIVYGKVPAPRGYHAAVLADSRLFLIGGFNGLQSFDDVHILELAASAYLPQVTSFNIEALSP